ncbi:hypothetical protein FB567DRAFT_554606 [Paraphoma chrysanthemicola]|uniref:Uncharacterized protein n=1 Tax=Paraphoma chrysanthemicola TaxID=798071 RepID=A0A8K0QVS7_9PLEO|nr:hypothetical protein FB567DRAFT_554606 [Paraphoma chrysanthemicola]
MNNRNLDSYEVKGSKIVQELARVGAKIATTEEFKANSESPTPANAGSSSRTYQFPLYSEEPKLLKLIRESPNLPAWENRIKGPLFLTATVLDRTITTRRLSESNIIEECARFGAYILTRMAMLKEFQEEPDTTTPVSTPTATTLPTLSPTLTTPAIESSASPHGNRSPTADSPTPQDTSPVLVRNRTNEEGTGDHGTEATAAVDLSADTRATAAPTRQNDAEPGHSASDRLATDATCPFPTAGHTTRGLKRKARSEEALNVAYQNTALFRAAPNSSDIGRGRCSSDIALPSEDDSVVESCLPRCPKARALPLLRRHAQPAAAPYLTQAQCLLHLVVGCRQRLRAVCAARGVRDAAEPVRGEAAKKKNRRSQTKGAREATRISGGHGGLLSSEGSITTTVLRTDPSLVAGWAVVATEYMHPICEHSCRRSSHSSHGCPTIRRVVGNGPALMVRHLHRADKSNPTKLNQSRQMKKIPQCWPMLCVHDEIFRMSLVDQASSQLKLCQKWCGWWIIPTIRAESRQSHQSSPHPRKRPHMDPPPRTAADTSRASTCHTNPPPQNADTPRASTCPTPHRPDGSRLTGGPPYTRLSHRAPYEFEQGRPAQHFDGGVDSNGLRNLADELREIWGCRYNQSLQPAALEYGCKNWHKALAHYPQRPRRFSLIFSGGG